MLLNNTIENSTHNSTKLLKNIARTLLILRRMNLLTTSIPLLFRDNDDGMDNFREHDVSILDAKKPFLLIDGNSRKFRLSICLQVCYFSDFFRNERSIKYDIFNF